MCPLEESSTLGFILGSFWNLTETGHIEIIRVVPGI